jgi:phosphatidylserine decarboxylase
MIIVKQGLPWAIVPGVGFFLCFYYNHIPGIWGDLLYDFVTIPLAVITILMLIFFRNPNRKPAVGYRPEISVLSPADGSLAAITEEDGNTVIYIEMHVRNVHVTRAPVACTVKSVSFASGNYYAIYYIRPQPGKQNEAIKKNARVIIEMEDSNHQTLIYNMICGKLARRARPFVKVGDHLDAGQRVGVIMFGSMVRIILPGTKYNMVARLNQNVYGGRTILCERL